MHDDLERIEYVDEMGRSRIGTRKEAMEAEMARRKSSKNVPAPPPAANSSYAEVLWVARLVLMAKLTSPGSPT